MDNSFDGNVMILMEMFPTIESSTIRTVLAAENGDIQAAIESILDPSTAKKRKRISDIRTYFQSNGRKKQQDIRIDGTTVPEEFLHPNKKMQLARFKQYDPTKETQRPMLLTSQTLAQHIPCLVLQEKFLPIDEANNLLRDLLETSKDWVRTKWVIVEREVESPHVTQLYGLDRTHLEQKNKLYTNTGTSASRMKEFTPLLHSVKKPIDDAVNRALSTRERHPLESNEPWNANLALGNLYKTPEESVGSHSDTMTELGPRPTIASYTIGAERIFRIKRLATDTMPAQTFNLKLPHNSLLIMLPPFQEFYRHEVPPQQPWQVKSHEIAHLARFNLTFRMMRANYVAHMPYCHCKKTAVLRTANRHTKKHVGEYFYMCAGSVPKSCSYFCWLKDRLPIIEGRTGSESESKEVNDPEAIVTWDE